MISQIESVLLSYISRPVDIYFNFTPEQEYLIESICNKYLLAGFVVSGLDKKQISKTLFSKLLNQKKIAIIKNLTMKNDLKRITEALYADDIDSIVLKGMAMIVSEIYEPGIRQCRDIDLLIPKDQIVPAFNALKTLGFRYLNADVNDQAKIFTSHALPAMINASGTIIELHWRITKRKSCDISKFIFENKRKISGSCPIYTPCPEAMIVHTLYHGILHHKYEHGPIFLFDMLAIYKHFGKVSLDNFKMAQIINNLGLSKEMALSQKILFKALKNEYLPEDIWEIYSDLLKGFNWEIDSVYRLLGVTGTRTPIRKIWKKVTEKADLTSNFYQMSKVSPKFWYYLMRDVLRALFQFRL